MNKRFFLGVITISLVAGLIVGCGGKKTVTTGSSNSNSSTSSTQATKPSESETAADGLYVRLEIVNKEDGVAVRIVDEQNKRITDQNFTVCLVPVADGNMIADKSQSKDVQGTEFTCDNGSGEVNIDKIESGLYELYLRPLDKYMNAEPVPITFAKNEIIEDILKKVKKSDEELAKKEDNDYQVIDEALAQKEKDRVIKINNIVNVGQIVGESKEFEVNVPLLDENDNVNYVKLNSEKLPDTIVATDCINTKHKEEIILDGVKREVYYVEKKRYDPRLDEKYISKAIIIENGEKYLYNILPYMTTAEENVYIGWYSRKGKQYYNDEDGYPISGWNKIDGAWYYFDEDGRKASVNGVDISQYQADIDWEKLKDAVDFVIIRCGFRGYGSGVLVEDSKFRENIQKATEYGVPFGVYIFSQAMNAKEAAEEASMCLALCQGYEPTLPYAIDIEACGTPDSPGRANSLTPYERGIVIDTFDKVIQKAGGEAILYACKSYLNHDIDMSQVKCKIWYAMWPGEKAEGEVIFDAYETDPNMIPDRPCEIWQFSDKGEVDGIEPLVDLNVWVPNYEE